MTFSEELLAWGAGRRADLPWRQTRDPWAILVSEVMLQQTQVTRVIPRYHQFLSEFPTPAACAAAPPAALLTLWGDLGYPRRAINLHRAATAIVERHGGELPDDLDALVALPGIGQYTARAVLAFAFERDHGVIDTNAARVLARALAGERLSPKRAQSLADELVPRGHAWAWNQAMLDLGATVCVKRVPRCGDCPVRSSCEWARAGWPPPDPAEGSAGVSRRQARFEGSDRQGRGRILAALRAGPLPVGALADAAGWPDDPERAERAALALVSEGLAEIDDDRLTLPV